ncbi:MAG: thioredoxin-disulfide reductase [Bacillota bacterium]
MMSDKIVYTDTERFATVVLGSEQPVIVDFYSEDCPPCSALAPLYERLSERYGDRLRFVKIMRQENRQLASSYGVSSSPTILFFKQGLETGRRLSGFIKKVDLRMAIDEVLGIKEEAVQRPEQSCDLVILGGGPAGLTAAIFAARAKLNTVVLDEGLPGGQAANTYHIANFPGTGGVVKGRELMDTMLGQAKSFGARVEDFKEIFEVNLKGNNKSVTTEDSVYRAPALIIATGAQPRKLPVPGEAEWRGRGIHYCATCDGSMYEGQKVIVVGGGNSAVEEAVFLTRYATEVTIVHEFDHLQATKTAQDEAAKSPKINFVWESHVTGIEGNEHLEGLRIKNLKTGAEQSIQARGVFVYIGTTPETTPFQGQLELDPTGYIKTDDNLQTSLPGIFAAGDVRVKSVRQVVTATGDGAIAAIQAERYISALSKG